MNDHQAIALMAVRLFTDGFRHGNMNEAVRQAIELWNLTGEELAKLPMAKLQGAVS